jgi:hypothetical protein
MNVDLFSLWNDGQAVLHAVSEVEMATACLSDFDLRCLRANLESDTDSRETVHEALLSLDRLLGQPSLEASLTCWGQWAEEWDTLGPPDNVELAGHTAALREVRSATESLLVEMLKGRAESDVQFWEKENRHWHNLHGLLERQVAQIERAPTVWVELLRRGRETPHGREMNPDVVVRADNPVDVQFQQATTKTPTAFVPTPLQKAILNALDGKAMKKQALADAVSKGEGTVLYRAGGLKELREREIVEHKRGVGFYRPDALPPDAVKPN